MSLSTKARLDLRLGHTLFKGAEVYALGQNMLAQYQVRVRTARPYRRPTTPA